MVPLCPCIITLCVAEISNIKQAAGRNEISCSECDWGAFFETEIRLTTSLMDASKFHLKTEHNIISKEK